MYLKEILQLRLQSFLKNCRCVSGGCRFEWSVAISGSCATPMVGLVACQGRPNTTGDASPAHADYPGSGVMQLPIQGFNYTDRTISSFYVNGMWGRQLIRKSRRGRRGGNRRGVSAGMSFCPVNWTAQPFADTRRP